MPPITQDTLTWYFKDVDWKNKFLVGSLFMLIATFVPGVGLLGYQVVYGYALVVMRATMRAEPLTLPKWERYGELFVDGFKAGLAAFGYLIPGIIAIVGAYGLIIVAIVLESTLWIPTTRAGEPAIPWLLLIGNAGLFLALGFAMLWFIATVIPIAIAVGQYARTGQIRAGYRLREVWDILRANIGGFVLALFVFCAIAIGISFLLQIVYMTIILCCLLPFISAPISFYLTLNWAYLFGLAYREGARKAGIALEPVELAASSKK